MYTCLHVSRIFYYDCVHVSVCVYKTHANKCTHNPHKHTHTHTHTLCIIHLCINIIYAQMYYNIQLQYNRKSQMFTSIALYIYTHVHTFC